LIYGTHIDAMVTTSYIVRYRVHKGVTQNVLVPVTLNKRFTYVMAGWEDSVEREATTNEEPNRCNREVP